MRMGQKEQLEKIKRKLFQFETEIIAEYKCSFQMKYEKGGNHWTKCFLSNEDQICSLSRKSVLFKGHQIKQYLVDKCW